MNASINLDLLRQQYSQFASQLLIDMGLNDLEQPVRGQLLQSIDQYLSQVMTQTILENIKPETAKRIDQLVQEDRNQEEIIAFLVAATPGLESKITEAMEAAYARMVTEVHRLTTEVAKDLTSGQETVKTVSATSAPKDDSSYSSDDLP